MQVTTGPPNRNLGRQVEQHRADARGGEHRPDMDFFDVEASDGTPVEVKSTRRTVENPSVDRSGRYQIVGDNHEELVEQGGEYDFVLRDQNDDELETVTLAAEEVDRIIAENDLKWPTGSKLKLSYHYIHENQ